MADEIDDRTLQLQRETFELMARSTMDATIRISENLMERGKHNEIDIPRIARAACAYALLQMIRAAEDMTTEQLASAARGMPWDELANLVSEYAKEPPTTGWPFT